MPPLYADTTNMMLSTVFSFSVFLMTAIFSTATQISSDDEVLKAPVLADLEFEAPVHDKRTV